MKIRIADQTDFETLCRYDRHIRPEELTRVIAAGHILIAEEDGNWVGWLRYNLFWDNTPFMNLLFVLDGWRGSGIGKALVLEWEKRMLAAGFENVMTSTASEEYAQHFYEKLGYRAIGGFLLPGEPYELVFAKTLN